MRRRPTIDAIALSAAQSSDFSQAAIRLARADAVAEARAAVFLAASHRSLP
jgi:hypothetical protein